MSPKRRSRYVFAESHWLPLRWPKQNLEGEEVVFYANKKLALRGTFLAHGTSTECQGTILFCHELNGTRSSITPYVDHLKKAGFNLFTFDFRNHGRSDSVVHEPSTPWVTTSDLEDVQAALKYLYSRSDTQTRGVSIFGLGKGATVALCAAGNDPKIRSLVLDAPQMEKRLFEKNCWLSFQKSTRLSRVRYTWIPSLLLGAVLYSITCPLRMVALSWRRYVLGRWYRCHFIDPCLMATRVKQPIMIVHGYADTNASVHQIQAFRERMAIRPKVWFAPSSEQEKNSGPFDACSRQVARFLTESTQ